MGIAHKFEGYRYGDVNASFFLVDSPPGGGSALHTHPYEEIFVTLEGEATFTAGDATIEADAGQIVVARLACPTSSSTPGPTRSGG
jgi:quercetin dioxygenase-like cupin family protein